MQEEDRFVRHEFIADKGQTPLRIDKFIVDRIENITRNKVQSAIQEGNVLVNGIAVKANYKIRPMDLVHVMVDEEPKEYKVEPEDLPINVVYEDEDLLVINKPPGVVVHPGVGNYTGTLSNALAFHFQDNVGKENQHPYLAHRIDKDTSGLLLIAKHEDALNFLAAQFKAHTIKRRYWALVWGKMEEPEGTITGNITRSSRDRKVFAVSQDPEIGKHAITHYKVIEDFTFTSLVECRLETGRTHQIRVHMKYVGHPIFSDTRYGGHRILKGVVFSKYKQFIENCFKIMPRQALHAKSLGFIHPRTKEEMYFESELHPDFQQVLDRWRNVSEQYSFEE
jgi:23S rRNA pseudouridine1911/1915/1917 synthase